MEGWRAAAGAHDAPHLRSPPPVPYDPLVSTANASTNPFLSLAMPVRWGELHPELIEPAVGALLAEARAALGSIGADGAARDYAAVLGVLDEATARLEVVMSLVSHLEATCTGPAIRAAYDAVRPAVSEFYAGIPLDPKLWSALKAYAETPDAKHLTGTRKRFLEKTLDEFRRSGADLDPAGKDRLRALSVQLAEVTSKFSQNVVDSTAAFELIVEDASRLDGLPDRARAAALAGAEARGRAGWRFGLDAPSYLAVLTYCEDRTLREALWHAFATRATSGPHDNRALVAKIVALRHEQALLLGFRDFADYVLADRMAKNGATADAFLARLEQKTRPAFERETRELGEYRRQLEGSDAPALAPWDVAFYAEKQRRALYDFDEEVLRPYLPVEQAIEGVFEVAHRLYGVRVESLSDAPVWHERVRAYAMREEGGALLGYFYLDLFPRETKRDGAWMGPFVTSLPGTPHAATICANLTPPSAAGVSLLTHRELETLFHEFGHLLHHLLSGVEVRSLAGTRVAWDFVELPSQIMENWCWEREGLDLVARHLDSGERVPDALFDKLLRAKNFRAATDQMRQLGFGAVDLGLHRRYDPARDGDVIAYARSIIAQHSVTALPEDYAMIASFGHLFGSPVGYAAAYYSYKWAEVLDADAFTRFRAEGIFSREVGASFRSELLARGDGEDPLVLYRAFMGRDPDPDAMLVRSGLL